MTKTRAFRANSASRHGMTTTAVGLVLSAAILAGPAAARAPEGNIEITVGTSPGGTPDFIMRQVGRVMNTAGIVENPIVIQNRTGGSWAISANYVIEQSGNEQLLYAIAQPVFTTPITQGLDTFHDKITPIAYFVQGDLVIVARADTEESLEDYVARAQEDPLSVSFVGAQAGSTDQIAVSLLEDAADVEFNYIPYDGGSAALASFLGGNSDLAILPPVEALPLMESGQIRPLAILNEERRSEPELADIPTARELGYDAVWGQSWGVAGPPDMDQELAQWWNDRFAELVEAEEWQAVAADSYFRSQFIGLEEARERTDYYYDQHVEILRDLGLTQ